MRTAEESLNILKQLDKLADWDRLPKEILDHIGYNPIDYSGVGVYLRSDGNIVFILHIPYEASEEETIPVEDVMFDKYIGEPR
jgi:hypothetical protein